MYALVDIETGNIRVTTHSYSIAQQLLKSFNQDFPTPHYMVIRL